MYKCDNCSEEFEKVGPKNLHQYHCTLKSKASVSTGESAKSEAAPPVEQKCSHVWRLLGNSIAERNARLQGYNKLCGKCGEVE